MGISGRPPRGPCSPVSRSAPRADDLTELSDSFDDSAISSSWQRVFEVEQWGFDQLESIDVGQTRAGWLTMIPHTSTWFQDYRGVLMFKPVTGDFVVTTRVIATNRAGTGAPSRTFSLAGIMIRIPRDVTPATWQPGGENYVFLSLGTGSHPGTFQTEVKSTIQSHSNLHLCPAVGPEARIRVARIRSAVLTLIREETTPWRIHRRFTRADFPAELQVGLTVYTDYATASAYTPEEHNTTLITAGTPDLRAQFDFVDYARPQVPPSLAGLDLTDPAQVDDAALLSFLGSD